MNGPKAFLLVNVALSFYLVGAIWAIEVDIFRSWRLVDPKDCLTVQTVHWAYLAKILRTPGIRPALINAYALVMLAWAMRVLA